MYESGSVGISFLEMPGCSSDLGHMIPSDSVTLFHEKHHEQLPRSGCGQDYPAPAAAVNRLFRRMSKQLRQILLNCCNSHVHGDVNSIVGNR